MKPSVDRFFQTAKNWADDIYVEAIASRNRYRFAFLWGLLIISLLLFGFVLLLPLQHTQLVLVHHQDDGAIWIELPRKKLINVNQAEVEGDIVRYVINRESYSATAYDHHYALVNLLSDESVAKIYQKLQSIDNPKSPINRFKKQVMRQVRVHNVIFLGKDKKHRLAQVNFTIIDHDRLTGRSKKHPMLALISWKYRGLPNDPSSRWQNWNGFTVTHYSIQQRHF